MKTPGPRDLPPGTCVERLLEDCRRWCITELALFGSFARGKPGPASDEDLLVTFDPEARWSLWDHIGAQEDLAEVFGRPVDLVTRRAVEHSKNWIPRADILGSARVVYAA
ncbi:MAG: nucleotidyltransferase [Alphaproteobacteria bacterium]|nr:nucleotidyltransferase [Alphaproteobacteria bacterium]